MTLEGTSWIFPQAPLGTERWCADWQWGCMEAGHRWCSNCCPLGLRCSETYLCHHSEQTRCTEEASSHPLKHKKKEQHCHSEEKMYAPNVRVHYAINEILWPVDNKTSISLTHCNKLNKTFLLKLMISLHTLNKQPKQCKHFSCLHLLGFNAVCR